MIKKRFLRRLDALLRSCHRRARRTEGYPLKYNDGAYRSFVFMAIFETILGLLVLVSFYVLETAELAALLTSVWIFAFMIALSEFRANKGTVRPFFSKQIDWSQCFGCDHNIVKTRGHGRIWPSYCPAVARNYRHLSKRFGGGADSESFLFQFKHGLVVPWNSELTNRLVKFFEQIRDSSDLLTTENGYDDPNRLRLEVDEILAFLEVAIQKGADCAIVLGGPCSDGFFVNGYF